MNISQAVDVFPALVSKSPSIADVWVELPGSAESPPVFGLRSATNVGLAYFHPQLGVLRLVFSVLADVGYSADSLWRVNALNRDGIVVFGKLFLVGSDETGRGQTVLDHVIFFEPFDVEHFPSLKAFVMQLSSVVDNAHELGEALQPDIGGFRIDRPSPLLFL